MKTYALHQTDLVVSRIALGCMTLGGKWDKSPATAEDTRRARGVVETALELGINFFDHADIYCIGKSEEVFGNVLKEKPALRQKVVLQSKCGIRFRGDPQPSDPHRFDFSYQHITWSAEQSLKRLATDHLDILLLHRPDPLVEPEEVARAFDDLKQSGKVRYFGVSNHSAMQMELLRKHLRQPLVVNQMELNLSHQHMVDQGVTANQNNQTYTNAAGILDYCRVQDIRVQAWSPAARGRLVTPAPNASDRELRIAGEVAKMAEAKGVSREAIVLAWLLRHPAGIQPVVGTTNLEHLRANLQADQVALSREEWYTLYVASRGGWLP